MSNYIIEKSIFLQFYIFKIANRYGIMKFREIRIRY